MITPFLTAMFTHNPSDPDRGVPAFVTSQVRQLLSCRCRVRYIYLTRQPHERKAQGHLVM